jgi:phosphate butyryltransferase
VANLLKRLADLFDAIEAQEPKTIAVAAAADQDVMDIVKQVTARGLANFTLVGHGEKIRALRAKNEIAPQGVDVVAAVDDKEAAEKAISLAVADKCSVVMKGNLHTATFLRAVLNKEAGFRKGNLISQVSIYDKFHGEGLQLLTDCAMIIEPGLEEKKGIIENAVELAQGLGIKTPRVALLSALETVNPQIPDTVDAAVLAKMGDRGQIKNAVIDGPFALDNAVSPKAARHKNLAGPVAGQADILVAPNLQVGNALTKALVFFAQCKVATAIMGTAKPIVMTSRTDTVENKILSLAMSLYISKA